jgi:hypothetical protein
MSHASTIPDASSSVSAVADTVSAAACWPDQVAVGALPGQPLPVFCNTFGNGPSTFVSSGNSWVDTFDHGLSMAEIGAGYRVFDTMGSTNQTKHWRHNNHWMVDVNGYDSSPGDGPWNLGGTTMRPDRSFRFQNGVLVVEADVAAGISGYGGAVWPELVVTTGAAPTFNRRDGVYNYDQFAGHDTIGCRLQSERTPICALFDNSTLGPGEGGRTWEISHFQNAGSSIPHFGGYPANGLENAWRVCNGTDPDINCRDRFRWEITRDSATLYVNGVLYMRHQGFTPLPDRFLNADVYVYFGSWMFKSDDATARFHWDRIAVNP